MLPPVPLGRTGLSAAPIGLGTRPLWGLPVGESRAVVEAALEAGVTLLETSEEFGEGRVERLLGSLLEGLDRAVVVARGGRTRGFDDEGLRHSVAASLERLRLDRIPVYLLERPTVDDLNAGAMERLAALRDRGWIGAIGASVGTEREGAAALDRGAQTIMAPFNLLQPAMGYRLIGNAAARGAAVLVREPLAGGLLDGGYGPDVTFPPGDFRAALAPADRERLDRSLKKLSYLATEGRTLAQAALQFVLAHEGVSAAVVGARTPDQIRGSVAALGAPPLTERELERIFELTAGCFEED